MFGWIVACAFAADVVGVDMGGQFLKSATMSISAGPKMVIDKRTGKPLTPSAIAFKAQRELSFPLNREDFNDIQLRIGADALSILKRRPSYGSEWLPKVVGRNESFADATSNNSTAFLRLLLKSYLSQFQGLESVGITMPFYTTRRQMSELISLCDHDDLPLATIVDEITAMVELYGAERESRFLKKPIHVLFVDVGATSVKAYGARFAHRSAYNQVDESGTGWSEQTGGYFFAKSIAEKRGISIKKAQKLLVSSQSPEIVKLYEGEIERLKEVVRDTFKLCQRLMGDVDEVQLIGGASTLKAVSDAVRDAVNGTVVKRDFNPTESIAKGALLATLMENDVSPYQPTLLVKRSFASLNVTCNKTQVYCQKFANCPDEIVEQSGGCDEIVVTADPADLPFGVDPVIARVSLKNITKADDGDSSIVMRMEAPYGGVRSVKVCRNGTCDGVEIEEQLLDADVISASDNLVRAYWASKVDEIKRNRLINDIGTVLGRLSALINEPGEDSEVTEEMTDEYNRALALLESGELRTLTRDELEPILATLNEIKQTLSKA